MAKREDFVKKDNLTLVHKTLPDTKIQFIPAETGRNGRHFTVRVQGKWIMQRTWIRPFHSLADAIAAI